MTTEERRAADRRVRRPSMWEVDDAFDQGASARWFVNAETATIQMQHGCSANAAVPSQKG